MTDLIQEIEKAIEKAADKHLREVNRNYNEIQQANMPNVLIGEGFDAGCAFILPLLKKCLIQRNEWTEAYYDFNQLEKIKNKIEEENKQLLKLLGENHERNV